MKSALPMILRSTHILRLAGTFTVCVLLQTASGYAQAPALAGASPDDVLVFEEMRVPRWLAETVVRAAQATHVDPAYMMALADKESSLLPDNKARTSSAEGLFQFIDATWLEVLRRFGPKHGYGAEAEAIRLVGGRPAVADAQERERLLGLRRDPYLSALMAGEMIRTHRETLAGKVARDPSFAELYMAHFLGVQGASRFVALLSEEPGKSARAAFPRAAKANRPLFFAEGAGRQGQEGRGQGHGVVGGRGAWAHRRHDRQARRPIRQRAHQPCRRRGDSSVRRNMPIRPRL
jgi:Transglycosylase SLT domain